MRVYDNPLIAVAYFLGIGVKKVKGKAQRAIDKRDDRKMAESAAKFSSSDEAERIRRIEISQRREKWAFRCLIFSVAGILLCYLTIDDLPILSVIILIPTVISIAYGLWYSLSGKYW